MLEEYIFIAVITLLEGTSMLFRFIIIVYRYKTIGKWLPEEAKVIDFDYEVTESDDRMVWQRGAKYT